MMNKKRLLPGCLVLSVLCLIAGCANRTRESEPILTETNSAAPLTEATPEMTEPVSRSDRSESAEQSALPTETTAAEFPEPEQKTVLWEAPNGELFYKEDAVPKVSVLAIEKAVYRPSTGIFYDSFINPELFDPETYDFLGELIEYDESDWYCIQTGDTINGYRVKKAETLFNIKDDGYLKEDGYIPLSNSIVFEDDITMTGYLSYYPDDESLYIQKGDVFFIPDQSYEGMPLVNYYPYCNVKSGKNYFDDEDEISLPVFYSDSISISVGNLFTDYADSAALKKIIEDDEKMKRIRVEITLGELSLTFHDMDMRIYGSARGKIVSVKEIETAAEVPESEQKTVLWEAPNGELFYKEDAFPDGSLLAFDRAVYRPSTGVFYDSFTNPELFDPETYEFLGDRVTYDESDWRCIHTGDTINGYTVECAQISFDVDKEVYFKANEITFREDVILTGYLMYCAYDRPVDVSRGNFFMLPDESFQGMPRVNLYPIRKIINGTIWEYPEDFVPPAYYNDAPVIPLGNLYRDYAENEDLKALVGDGTESKKIKAEVTIGHLSLCFADMMDEAWTSGKIVSVKELESTQ